MKRVAFLVDGATVQGQLHQPQGRLRDPVPLVVCIHGLASSQVEWYDFPERLSQAGYAVLTFDLRGHGRSEGPRGFVSIPRVQEDVEAAIEAMKAEYGVDTRRIGLIGHSLGAAMAVSIAQEIEPVKAVVAMAPPSRLSREVNFFESIGYFVADKVNRPLSLLFKEGLQIPYKTPYTRLYASRASVKRGMADDFLQTKIPVANYKGLMVDLDAEEAARSLKKPTIVLIAEYDLVVGNWNSRAVYAALAAKHRDLVLIPKSGHSMQGDHRSQLVLDHTRRWLDRHVKGAKS